MAMREMRGSEIEIWRWLDFSLCLIEITSRQAALVLEIMHTGLLENGLIVF